MTSKEIREKLEELYTNKKARNFLNHLIKAYFPVSKVEKVMGKPRGAFRCAITNESLISTNEMLSGMQSKEFQNDFNNNLKTMFGTATDAEHPLSKLIGDKKFAVSSDDTTTHLAYSTYQVFHDWVATKMLMGDKHINWVLNDVNRSEFVDRAETINNPKLKNKVNKIKKASGARTTYALADSNLSALQALKDKMS